MFEARLAGLRQQMQGAGLEALLVADPANSFYLSGLNGGEGMVLVTAKAAFLLVDPRLTIQARQEVHHLEIVEYSRNFYNVLEQLLKDLSIKSIAYEVRHVSVEQVGRHMEKVPGVIWRPGAPLVEQLRLVKDAAEIACIGRAAAITDAAWADFRPRLRAGISERELAGELEYALRRHGADGFAFPTIVVSGPRSAMAHGIPSGRALRRGDLVITDFGAVYRGYCADLTRTVVIGELDSEQQKVFQAVVDAGRAALEEVRPGVTAAYLEEKARQVLKEYGYESYFGHRLGHGVGISVHEGPSFREDYPETLQAGMVITIEPGVYIEGWGGIRVEDLVLVTTEGGELLSHAPQGIA